MATEVQNKAVGYDSGLVAAGALTDLTLSRTKALRATDAHAHFQDAVLAGRVFSMALTATTTGVAAGNIVGAAAAASTNFALFNPVNSAKNYVLWKLGIGIISGTPGAGPLFHCVVTAGVPTVATTGTILNNLIGGPGSTAKGWATAAGTTLTAGGALVTLRLADFASTATAQASVGLVKAVELIDGDICIPPGVGYVPAWGAAGTSLLSGYSLTWEEVSV